MVLTGLLLIALVSVVLGVVLGSTLWFIVSLGASVLAAFFLIGAWRTVKERRAEAQARQRTAEPPRAAHPRVERPNEVWVVDGRPAYHRVGCAELAGPKDEPVP